MGDRMNKEQIVGLAVRLFAVFLVVYTLRYATSIASFAIIKPPNFAISSLIILIGIFPLLIAFLLWCFPLKVASRLIPRAPEHEQAKPLSDSEIQVVAF